MKLRISGILIACALSSGWSLSAQAVTVNVNEAVAMSLKADPRIKEQQQVVEEARGLLDEAKGHGGVMFSGNSFLGIAPAVSGGIYSGGAQSGTTLRSDEYPVKRYSDWEYLEFSIIKPLYTFGKLHHYTAAARNNILVKKAQVQGVRLHTAFDTRRAYYGYLTARDTTLLLEDILQKVNSAIATVKDSLKKQSGDVTQSDLYALQAGRGELLKYISQAKAIKKISLDGLKVLTGVGLEGQLKVADDSLEPVAFPKGTAQDYINTAIANRPEFAELKAGLEAQRQLVAAKHAGNYPNVYAGLVGTLSHASRRSRLNNPYIYDPFNSAGVTPVIGIEWDMQPGVVSGQVRRAQAQLNALNDENRFAEMGIPFQVSEAVAHMDADYRSVEDLRQAAESARRWMVSSFAD
ncbi:MAG: TolC family protein, partial [Pseudomonadota bacterium]|nr:TolC family protein [Pseudomonadota bacterium]